MVVRAQAAVPMESTAQEETETPVARAAARASAGAVFGAFAFVLAGGFGAFTLFAFDPTRTAIRPGDAGTTFLTLFVFAVGVERLLEPLSRWLPGAGAVVPAGSEAGARGKANRTVVAWGLACALGSVASSATGFYLLRAIAGPDWNGVTVWIDAVITGLMIGGGTKPLHDLIGRMQAIKDGAKA